MAFTIAARLGTLSLVTGITLLLAAPPAFAHGGGGPDASNYLSLIRGVVVGDGTTPGEGDPIELDGVTWQILGNDALLEVRNDTGTELTVPGYQGEPYLRVGPDGVYENRNSPAVYLSSDRFAQTPVPDFAGPDKEPNWVRVSGASTYAWHDHRIHWMAPTLPPQVKVDATRPVKVNDWAVPFQIDGRELAVEGTLRWEPPPSWIPWVVAAVLATVTPVATAIIGSSGEARRRRALRTTAVVFAIAVVLNVVHGVDDLVAVPATAAQNIWAGAQTFVPLLIAAWAARKAFKADLGATQLVVVGGFIFVLMLGLTHIAVLTSSQVATTLPEWFTRAVVAMNLALAAPTVVAILASGELRPAAGDATGDMAEEPA